jgi:hypothetical protein
MSQQTETQAASEGPSVKLIQVWGRKKNGDPFHAINVVNPEHPDDPGKALMISQGLMGILKDSPDVSKDLQERIRKATLWYMTHRAISDKETGNVKIVPRKEYAKTIARTSSGEVY